MPIPADYLVFQQGHLARIFEPEGWYWKRLGDDPADAVGPFRTEAEAERDCLNTVS